MPQIGPREIAAEIAVALGVQGGEVALIPLGLDVDPPEGGEEGPVAPVARGEHTVEHVHAPGDALHDVRRVAHPHQVTRPLLRHDAVQEVQDAVHDVVGLPHREPADPVPGEVHRRDLPGAPQPQVVVDGALYDPEESLVLPGMGGPAPSGPQRGALQGRRRLFVRRREGTALVEAHGDVAAQKLLHPHRPLGGHHVFLMSCERH